MIYRACERFHILPEEFLDLCREDQISLLSFSQIREIEEKRSDVEKFEGLAQIMAGTKAKKMIG